MSKSKKQIDNSQIEALLSAHGLKKTKVRKLIINQFLSQRHALSYNDLAEEMPYEIDKSTIYRNLAKLEEKYIIHPVENTTGILKYALGKPSMGVGGQHAHFQCIECDEVFCLNETDVVTPSVPKNFTVKSTNITLKGTCEKCNIN